MFNAHYLAYLDDTLENWCLQLGPLRDQHGWDMMLKRATIEWHGSVGNGEWLEVDAGVRRWGRSSWLVGYVGRCEGRGVFDAEVLYVSVRQSDNASFETPEAIREVLSRASAPEPIAAC